MRPYIFPEYVDAYSSRLAAARNGLFVFFCFSLLSGDCEEAADVSREIGFFRVPIGKRN